MKWPSIQEASEMLRLRIVWAQRARIARAQLAAQVAKREGRRAA